MPAVAIGTLVRRIASIALLCALARPAIAQEDCGATAAFTAFVGSAAWDIARASESARKYNRTHFAVAPFVDARDRRVGLRFSLPTGRAAAQWAPELKSPERAFGLSLVWTLLPSASGLLASNLEGGGTAGFLIWTGLTFGPSMGHFYADQDWRGLGGIGLRLLFSAAMVGATVSCFEAN